jgi:hypothetical protein
MWRSTMLSMRRQRRCGVPLAGGAQHKGGEKKKQGCPFHKTALPYRFEKF